MNYKHFSIDERVILSQLLVSKLFQKKNGKPNLSKIAKAMDKHRSTILREINRFYSVKYYNAVKAHKKYLKNTFYELKQHYNTLHIKSILKIVKNQLSILNFYINN